MIHIDFKDKRMWFVVVTVAILSLVALWLRIMPVFSLGPHPDLLTMTASDDPLYNLRQVEVILANFPNYAWFDPMTLFPIGSNLNWGPVFPLIIAIACLITGATARPEILSIGLLIPPIMAAVMVPVMYYIGKICGDWKTGLLSAFFIAVVSGQYFSRSFYGYMDHHIAEVLFSAIFCLMYMYTLYSEKDTNIVLKDVATYKKTVLLSVLTGVAYLSGHFVMPTMILFAMIVAIFTIIQFLVDGLKGRSSEYLVVINTVTFATAIIGILIFGIKNNGVDLVSYTIGHVYALLVLIGMSFVLYGIYVRFGQKDYFQAVKVIIFSIAILLIVIFALSPFIPQIYYLFVTMPINFFGQRAISSTIQESMPWSITQAWATFNYGLLLMFGGVIIMIYKNFKSEHPHYMFGLVWALIVLISAWQHIRYEYYLTVPLVLVSAVCVSTLLDLGLPHLLKVVERLSPNNTKKSVDEPDKKKNKKKLHRKESSGGLPSESVDYIIVILVSTAIIISLLFGYISFTRNYDNATRGIGTMNPDWKESLDWMYSNTPVTGMNFTEIYDPLTFQYPSQAYGVMSWWDYGHMITYIAKRIPNANPFQEGVIGPNGSAAFFIAQTESEGNAVLDNQKTRYVMTDIEMDTGKFWAMATWYNQTLGVSPYQIWMFAPQQTAGGGYDPVQFNTQNYYNSMISRLHTFDGTLISPQTVYYIEYIDPSVSQLALPVINGVVQMNVTDVDAKITDYNQRALPGYHATKISPVLIIPTHKIPALQHYRLVHESPNGIYPNGAPDLKYVKTFEYVKGARIPGAGLIEIDLISNTGRKFTYQQESVTGEFVLPYSTVDNPYGVKAISKYRINGVDLPYEIPERVVMDGGELRKVA